MARRTTKRTAPRRYKEKYPSSRAKGFITYKPRGRKRLIGELLAIRDLYAAFTLHPRGYFYRLLDEYGYDKTDALWDQVKDTLVKMRRGRLLPFGDVGDKKVRVFRPPLSYRGTDQYWRVVRSMAENYRRDRDDGQSCVIEIIVESLGTIDIVTPVADKYGVVVYTSSGFNGVNMMRDAAERAVTRMRPTVILHLGDLDSSGECMYDAVAEDVTLFAEGLTDEYGYDMPDLTFVRVALTREQVERLGLPSKPATGKDRRGDFEGGTVQLEALKPTHVVELVEAAILDHYDAEIWDALIEEEAQEWNELNEQVNQYLPDED